MIVIIFLLLLVILWRFLEFLVVGLVWVAIFAAGVWMAHRLMEAFRDHDA